MTFLAVLDQSPMKSAEAHADIHLAPSITRCAQLISTAAQECVPSEIRLEPNEKGIKEFRFNDMVLLPPIKDAWVRPWIDWVKEEYKRSWWVTTCSWFFDKELLARFTTGQHPDAIRLNLWVQKGITRVFSKNGKDADSFPLVLPAGVQFFPEKGTIDNYRAYYAGLDKNTRMKWSGPRFKPEFLGGPKVKNQQFLKKEPCYMCQSDAGTACSLANCPLATDACPF